MIQKTPSGWMLTRDGDVYGPFEEEGEAKKEELRLIYEEQMELKECRSCRGL